MIIPRHRLSKIIALVATCLVLASSVAGCSDDDEGSGDESGLLGALAKVRATDSSRTYVEYGDAAKARELVEADRRRFQSVQGYGVGNIRAHARKLADDLALDPLAFREAVQVGRPPDWAAILLGDYDVDEVNRRLADRGIERADSDGSTSWTISADGDIDVTGPLAGTVPLNEFNNVRTQRGSFAYSPKRDDLTWVTDPGKDTLAKDPTMRALAGCLGEVMAAVIMTGDGDAGTVAVGVRAPSTSDVTEVICVAPGSADRAEELRDHAARQFENGESPHNGVPWAELLPEAKVELTGSSTVVRIVAKPRTDGPVGTVTRMLQNRDLNELLGV